MSNAKQCDRCKSYYPALVQGIDWDNEDWWRYSLLKDYHPYPEEKIDLCPECRKKLVDWLKEGEKNEKFNS